MKTKAFTLIEVLVVCAIIGILVALVAGPRSGCSRSEGIRIGTITKFSYRGNFTKSWEGELLLGGVRNSGGNSGIVANVWDFSVAGGKDSALVARIHALVGKQVRVRYSETAFHNPFAATPPIT